MTSGFSLDDPSAFASRIHRMIKLGLSLEDEQEEEIVNDALPPLEAADTAVESKMEEVD